ncbi:SDR family oxidoreductase [Sphingomonas baiyangensis]|uniref:SDR family oxidoreductase n=1 Tax=Sphingomonas baiyangensis TaxID=2572576 RepID=A0A4U1L9S7_9SPHN|nr:SDR family oxidoreductase [Sphingomonas baiyangensis]TKD53205.1 SDR family oxidoreductase [Sphingomonas baiyangensis]
MSVAPLALVTGSRRRLGAHIAAALAEAGYDIAVHGSRSVEPEAWLVDRIAAAGREWQGFACDLDDLDAAEALVDRVAQAFARPVALLVNNASRFDGGESGLPSAAALVAHFRTNSAAPMALAMAVARQPGDEVRSVVNILDQRIARPHRDQIAYTLSKQALAEATRTLAVALAPRCRVNAVAPGLTIATDDYTPEQLVRLAAMMPLGRLSQPADIAAAVVHLAQAPACTGQTLYVDGGAAQQSYARDFVHLARG